MRLFFSFGQTKKYSILIIEKRPLSVLLYRSVLGTNVKIKSVSHSERATSILSKLEHLDLFVSRLEDMGDKKDTSKIPLVVRQKFENVPIVIFNNGSAFDHRLWRVRRIKGVRVFPKKFGAFSILRVILRELRRQEFGGSQDEA